MKKSYLFSAIICLLVVFSCNQGNNENKQDESTQKENTIDELATLEEEEDFPFIMPSPLQIASIFKKSGLKYIPNVTNSTANISKYTSQFSKSLNFGVYSADLSYCVLNNQSQDAINYMKMVRQLSDELGISSIFNSEGMFKSFEKNIGKEDSMVTILARVQEQLDEHLEETGQQHMSAVYFAGGWIEALYIGSKVIDKNKKGELAKRLVEQITILDMLIRGLEANPGKNQELETMMADLKQIKEIYDNFDSVKKLSAAGEEAESLDDFKITDEEFDKVAAKIQEIRTRITN